MEGQKGCPRRLRHPGEVRRHDVPLVPAGAELHADGQSRVPYHRGDHLFRQRQVQQQGTAVPVPGDLPGRAAAVDVQAKEVVPQLLRDHPGRHAHGHGVAAEELHPQGPLLGAGATQEPRFFVGVQEPLGGDHLREGEIATLLPAQTPKDRVRIPGHGGQEQRRLLKEFVDGHRKGVGVMMESRGPGTGDSVGVAIGSGDRSGSGVGRGSILGSTVRVVMLLMRQLPLTLLTVSR